MQRAVAALFGEADVNGTNEVREAERQLVKLARSGLGSRSVAELEPTFDATDGQSWRKFLLALVTAS